MDPETLVLGKLLNWADKRRGAFTYSDVEREFSWPRELSVALVRWVVGLGFIEAMGQGHWKRKKASR